MSDFGTGKGWDLEPGPRRTAEESAEHLYTARPLTPAPQWLDKTELPPLDHARGFAPNEPAEPAYTPNELSKPSAFPAGKPEPAPLDSFGFEAMPAEMESAGEEAAEWGDLQRDAYYRRDFGDEWPQEAAGEAATAFAPPPKFEYQPYRAYDFQPKGPGEDQEGDFAKPQANVYQTRAATWAETARRESLAQQRTSYQVEGESRAPRKRRRKKKLLKRFVVALCGLAVLGAGAYLSRDWIAKQLKPLTGATQTVGTDAVDMTQVAAQSKGYDPATAVHMNEKAQLGIAAVSGTLKMETYAVTTGNVVGRTQTGPGLYDYYLFAAADGQLLGYYEGLADGDFLVQQGDRFYVRQQPYLLTGQGKPLIDQSNQYLKNAVLEPMMNGWAMLRDEAEQEINFINQDGQLLSTLWFCKAFPFTGERTVGYVDTGNLTAGAERYTLYALSESGEMEKWRQGADAQDVVGSACGMAYLNTGELYDLKDLSKPICVTDDVAVYADCEAVVVKDQATGKYGLFVDGEQHYDFAYDRIAPVECDIQWKQTGDPRFKVLAVTKAAYPQPLSHYFTLQKDGAQELVAVSTRSVYPIALEN